MIFAVYITLGMYVLVRGECLSMDSFMVHYDYLPCLIAEIIARIRTTPYMAILSISNLFFSVTIQLLLRLQGHFTATQPWWLSIIAAEWDLSRSTCFVSTSGNILHDDDISWFTTVCYRLLLLMSCHFRSRFRSVHTTRCKLTTESKIHENMFTIQCHHARISFEPAIGDKTVETTKQTKQDEHFFSIQA